MLTGVHPHIHAKTHLGEHFHHLDTEWSCLTSRGPCTLYFSPPSFTILLSSWLSPLNPSLPFYLPRFFLLLYLHIFNVSSLDFPTILPFIAHILYLHTLLFFSFPSSNLANMLFSTMAVLAMPFQIWQVPGKQVQSLELYCTFCHIWIAMHQETGSTVMLVLTGTRGIWPRCRHWQQSWWIFSK